MNAPLVCRNNSFVCVICTDVTKRTQRARRGIAHQRREAPEIHHRRFACIQNGRRHESSRCRRLNCGPGICAVGDCVSCAQRRRPKCLSSAMVSVSVPIRQTMPGSVGPTDSFCNDTSLVSLHPELLRRPLQGPSHASEVHVSVAL